LLESTVIGERILLKAPSLSEVTPYQDEQRRLESFVGRVGVAQTLLNPGGLVRVEAAKLHAFSEGMLIDSGTAVEIVEVRGTRVLVRPARTAPGTARAEEPREEPFLADSRDADRPAAPLDFDLPQN
jgi:membrane-bound ClpP family serine protease